jgi:uncharacterized protein YkwD
MKNVFYILSTVIVLAACVSKTELAALQQEYADIRSSNKEIKLETRLYQDSQKILNDTFYAIKNAFLKQTEKRKQEERQRIADKQSDSLRIETCLFATREEKNAYHYLNYARTKPKEFCEKFVVPNWDKSNSYHNSLVKTLRAMAPVPPVFPEFRLFQSALCHARTSGKTGYVGHDRQKDPRTGSSCNSFFMGECCSYGRNNGLGIILQLLIDNGVPSLGHREICLSRGYTNVGISIQPHEGYNYNTVLDFM